MEPSPVVVENVRELQESRKRLLEDILGQTLGDNQRVFIMAFTPGEEPTEEARRAARAGLERTWTAVAKHMLEQNITDEEFDAADDEAMDHVRPREP